MKWIIASTLLALALGVEKVNYKGFKGLQIETPDNNSVEIVSKLAALGVKILHEASTKRPSEVAVPPNIYNDVIKTLTDNKIKFEELYSDLQAVADEQKRQSVINSKMARFRSFGGDDTIATYFPTYQQTVDFLSMLERKYRGLAQLRSVGKSYEGRDQLAIQIGTPGNNKPVIWVDGGIHAREWATVPTVLYFAQKLLSGHKGETKALLDRYDFYLLPIFNPDGYVHTHEVDRFWRKNRRPHSRAACAGVDLNRNFGHHWGVSGVSHKPCDDSFLGPRAFSEPETKNVRDTLLRFKGRLQMYMNLHAYGQLWFVPFAYDNRASFKDEYAHFRVGKAAADAIYRSGRGTRYRVGKPGDLLYNAAGGTFDWVYAVAGAKYAFAAELSPSFYEGRGLSGFDISPNRLPTIAREVYNGLKAAIEAM